MRTCGTPILSGIYRWENGAVAETETEWKVICAKGHVTYERLWGVLEPDVRWSDCAKCGAPRRGAQLPPVR